MTGVAILVFGILSVACPLLVYWRIRRVWLGAAISSVIAAGLFQLIAYLQLGYVDPFFEIALIGSAVLAFIIAIPIGYLFKVHRADKVGGDAQT